MPRPTFRAAWWLPGGHGQTLWPVMARRVPVTTRPEMLELPDGDITRLDWAEPEATPEAPADLRPIVILLPGLQGGLDSQYLRGMLLALRNRGWRAVLLNHRGRPEPNRLATSYHCGFTDDLAHLVGELRRRHPAAPLAVVGFSLGANICLKWLGEAGRDRRGLPVRAAVCLCAPFHLGAVARRIERGFSRIYQNRMLRCLKSDVRRKLRQRAAAAQPMPLDLDESMLGQLDTFRRFDDRITAPMHGFESADDYYHRNRTDTLVGRIDVPTLIVNADDDPLIPTSLIPEPRHCSGSVRLEVTRSGGHMGFVTGRHPLAARYWLERRVPAFVAEHFIR